MRRHMWLTALAGAVAVVALALSTACIPSEPAFHAPDGGVGGDGSCGADPSCDPLNCGAVGHDCLGGGCVDRVCQPAVLADMQDHPTSIKVVAGFVFWINQGDCTMPTGQVLSASLDGKNRKTLAQTLRCPEGLVVAGNDLHFALRGSGTGPDGEIQFVARDGTGGNMTRFPGRTHPGGLISDGTLLYWAESFGTTWSFYSGPIAGTPTSTLVASITFSAAQSLVFNVQAGRIYFGSSTPAIGLDEFVGPAGDGGVTPSASVGGTTGTDSANDIAFSTAPVKLVWIEPNANASIFSVEPDVADSKHQLATSIGTGRNLRIGGDQYVYYTSKEGVVGRVPLAGGAPAELRKAPVGVSSPGVTSIDVDDSAVYWTEESGRVMRLRKP